MNEMDVIAALMRERYAKSFCLHRYTPDKWWECDVMEITKSGLWREYEIKLSKADFLLDAKKTRLVLPHRYGKPQLTENKHDELAKEGSRGPSQFWYVVPAGMIEPEDVPAWAGLIVIWQNFKIDDETGLPTSVLANKRLTESERKKAPYRHREKVSDGFRSQAAGTCYWRMHRLIQEDAKKPGQ